MATSTLEVSARQPGGWNAFLEKEPTASVLSSSGFARVQEQAFGFKPMFFRFVEGKEISAQFLSFLRPVLGGVAKTCFSYAPPVVPGKGGVPEVGLLEAMKQHAFKQGAGVFSFWSSPYGESPALEGYERFGLADVVWDLSGGEEKALKRVHKRARRNIRRAQEAGLRVRPATREDLMTFYNHYSAHHQAVGLEVYPQTYFAALFEEFVNKGDGHFLVAEKDSTFAAGLMVSRFNKRLHELAVAHDPEHLDAFPNDALKWHAAKEGIRQGCSAFNLSSIDTGESKGASGVNRFKKKFGEVKTYAKYRAFASPLVQSAMRFLSP